MDAGNGAMYKLTPDQVQATLSKSETQVLYWDREMFIFVTLRAAPDWERVAALIPEADDRVQ